MGTARPISTSPPGDPVARWAGRLLAMVHELHKAGYQQLRICAGYSPDGREWRCRILPSSQVRADGWTPAAEGVQYSSSEGKRFFGWTDTDHDDARALARKFVERFPAAAREGTGPDWLYAGWFAEILGRAEHGELPVFYEGFELQRRETDAPLPPPPVHTVRAESYDPTGFPLIANDALTVGQLPPPGAGYEDLYPFCLSFDGCGNGLRTIDDCLFIADSVEARGLRNASIESLRVTAFSRQRAIKWMELSQPSERLVTSIRSVVEELRRRLEPR